MSKKKKEPKELKEKLMCIQCNLEKVKETNFYNTNSELYKNLGKVPVCKECVRSLVDYNNMETVYALLRQFDIKFDVDYWVKARDSKFETIGRYITMANSLPQFSGTGWNDSVFETKTPEGEIKNSVKQKTEFQVTDALIDKWGMGYEPIEYQLFERKYSRLINNYGEKTALHTEGLISYIRFRVKEEMATARGSVKEASEWGKLASKAATDAKINVSQLSKSDISGGVDVLSQLFEAVESEVGIIPLLPRVVEQPYDDVDLVIWALINYYRRLEDKPLVQYRDIYNFYDEMLQEYFTSKGLGENEIAEFKAQRNNVFRDLGEIYKEPLYESGDD